MIVVLKDARGRSEEENDVKKVKTRPYIGMDNGGDYRKENCLTIVLAGSMLL